MKHAFLIVMADGTKLWTDGRTPGMVPLNPDIRAVRRGIAAESTFRAQDSRPTITEDFDGIETIFNRHYVQMIVAFPLT